MIIKHSDLINTLIVCVGGFGFIAGLLRYVDDWRENEKKNLLSFLLLRHYGKPFQEELLQ